LKCNFLSLDGLLNRQVPDGRNTDGMCPKIKDFRPDFNRYGIPSAICDRPLIGSVFFIEYRVAAIGRQTVHQVLIQKILGLTTEKTTGFAVHINDSALVMNKYPFEGRFGQGFEAGVFPGQPAMEFLVLDVGLDPGQDFFSLERLGDIVDATNIESPGLFPDFVEGA